MGPKNSALVVSGSPAPAGPVRGPRRTRLTESHVRALKSREAPYFETDPDCPGLQLHVGATLTDGSPGAKSWRFRFYWRGKRTKLALGTFPTVSPAAARAKVVKVRASIEQGIDPRRAGIARTRTAAAPAPATAVEPGTVADLAEQFMRLFVKPHRKRPEYVQRILDTDVLPHWRTRDARTIKPREVVELLDGIVARGSRTMANRTAGVLSQMFRYGVQRGLVDASPVQLLYRPGGEEKPRSRVLSDPELSALLKSADQVFRRAPRTSTALRIALLTACRRGELALAEWSHLDLDGNAPTWRIPPENSKTETEYLVPLVPAAVEQFRVLKRSAGRARYVMPGDDGIAPADPKLLTRSVARHLPVLAKLKVAAFTLHDLRRTVRTGLARLKVPPHIAERVLNHAQPDIVATYDVHQYLDEKRDALEKWAAHLAALSQAAT